MSTGADMTHDAAGKEGWEGKREDESRLPGQRERAGECLLSSNPRTDTAMDP